MLPKEGPSLLNRDSLDTFEYIKDCRKKKAESGKQNSKIQKAPPPITKIKMATNFSHELDYAKRTCNKKHETTG